MTLTINDTPFWYRLIQSLKSKKIVTIGPAIPYFAKEVSFTNSNGEIRI